MTYEELWDQQANEWISDSFNICSVELPIIAYTALKNAYIAGCKASERSQDDEAKLGRCLVPVLTGENWDDLMDCYKRYVRLTEETEEDGELCDDDPSEILEKYHGCFRKILQAIQDECNNS